MDTKWKDHYLGAHVLYEFVEAAGDVIVDIRLIASSVAVGATHFARDFFFHHTKLVAISVPVSLASATVVAVAKKRRKRRKTLGNAAFSGGAARRARLLDETGDCRECQAKYLKPEELNATDDY